MQYSFDTTGPLVADIAIRSGRVDVVNGTGAQAEVTIVGHDDDERDDIEVSFDGRLLLVREPEGILAFWGPSRPVTVTVSIPSTSEAGGCRAGPGNRLRGRVRHGNSRRGADQGRFWCHDDWRCLRGRGHVGRVR